MKKLSPTRKRAHEAARFWIDSRQRGFTVMKAIFEIEAITQPPDTINVTIRPEHHQPCCPQSKREGPDQWQLILVSDTTHHFFTKRHICKVYNICQNSLNKAIILEQVLSALGTRQS